MRAAGELSAVKFVRRRKASKPFVSEKPLSVPALFVSTRIWLASLKVNEVTMEAGNCPDMIFKHYRELVTEKEGDAWFGSRRRG
jgi:hypothetical protein